MAPSWNEHLSSVEAGGQALRVGRVGVLFKQGQIFGLFFLDVMAEFIPERLEGRLEL